MNTGTHKSGGIHWQGIYFDQDHRVYFFDSFGRQPMAHFKLFAQLLLTFSSMRQFYRRHPVSEVLSKDKFTLKLYKTGSNDKRKVFETTHSTSATVNYNQILPMYAENIQVCFYTISVKNRILNTMVMITIQTIQKYLLQHYLREMSTPAHVIV